MKRSDLFFASLLIPLDFLMIAAAGSAAYFLRFQAFSEILPIVYTLPFSVYLEYLIAADIFFIAIFAISGLYTIGYQRIPREVQRIFTACSTAILAFIVLIFFRHELFSSRFIVLAAWILSIIFVLCGRLLLRGIKHTLFSSGHGLHPIAVIGSNRITNEFIQLITSNPGLGLTIVHMAPRFDEETMKILADKVSARVLDELYVMDTGVIRESFDTILTFAQLHHIGVRYSADFIGGRNLEMSIIGGIPIVEIKKTKLDGWWRIIKRAFDLTVALLMSLLLIPVYLVIAFAICLDSKGPAIYKNIRVGQRGNFITYKFRSMELKYCTGTDYDPTGQAEKVEEHLAKELSVRKGPVFKVLNDPRRTRVGRFLERTSLDELPQLWNVIKGNMSLVGPRPHMPNQVAGYGLDHHKVFSVKPGITGLAQISGRSDLDFDDETALDIFYSENWSFKLDLIILIKTPLSILMRKSRV